MAYLATPELCLSLISGLTGGARVYPSLTYGLAGCPASRYVTPAPLRTGALPHGLIRHGTTCPRHPRAEDAGRHVGLAREPGRAPVVAGGLRLGRLGLLGLGGQGADV